MKNSILLITGGFPFDNSERGFLETEFEELTRHFQVNVLAMNVSGGAAHGTLQDVQCWECYSKKPSVLRLPVQLRYPEVRDDIVSCWSGVGLKKKVMRTLRVLMYSLRAENLCRQIEDIVIQQNITLIYTYWCTQATVMAVRLKKRHPELKVITRFHGFDLYKERIAENWQPLRPFIAKNADFLVFACQKGKEYFVNEWPGVWETRCKVCYIGTKAMHRLTVPKRSQIVLISCSNLIPLKRVDMIIKGLAMIPSAFEIEWHHVGDGVLRDELEGLAKYNLEPKGNITYKFWGAQEHDKIEKIYHMVRPCLFITVSSTEGGAPVSIQEAFAMGVPAIGTNVGGIGELIENGENGCLLPANVSAEQIAHAIEDYGNLTLAQKSRMAEKAFEKWEELFVASRNAKDFMRLFDR